LIPAGNKVGIVKLNYQMFRRGFATDAHDQGASDKSIQGQLRHASVNTSRNNYMQTIPASQREAVQNFSKVVGIKKVG
jgi:integrase